MSDNAARYLMFAFLGGLVGAVMAITFGPNPASTFEETLPMLTLGAGIGAFFAFHVNLSHKRN